VKMIELSSVDRFS